MRYFDNSPFQTNKIKDLFISSDKRNTNNSDEYLSVVRDVGVIKYSERGDSGNKTSDSPEKYKMVDVGDLVINPMNVTIGSVGISEYSGCLSGVYLVLKPKTGVNSKYYHYLFHDKGFQKYLKTISYGIMEIRESINKIEFFQFKVPKPQVDEQKEIVSYLDKKTNQINELIKKIEQKIDLITEQRNSLINEVVTQGLNPNVEKKESGVEWIGKIPSHWKTSKLKYLVSENQESLSNSTDPDLELDYIEISDVNSIGEFKKPTKYIFSESPSRCRRICRKGDVIISTVRTYLKSIGIIEEQRENLICSTGFSVLTPKSEYLSKYVFYMLRSNWFLSKIISKSEGVSYPSIQSHKLLVTDVITINKQEQQQIVEYLDEQTQKIDETIYKEEKRIELLKEYKQSLISEVVTGKKRVV